MSVGAIGEHDRVAGYGLAGVAVFVAADAEAAVAAWDSLPPDVELLLLSHSAYRALASRLDDRRLLWVELPE